MLSCILTTAVLGGVPALTAGGTHAINAASATIEPLVNFIISLVSALRGLSLYQIPHAIDRAANYVVDRNGVIDRARIAGRNGFIIDLETSVNDPAIDSQVMISRCSKCRGPTFA